MKRHILTILSSLLLLTVSASSAFATDQNECQVDSDCGDSYICVESTSACTAPPCEPGSSCPEIDCEPVTYTSCEPAPPASCETTADCTSGLVCLSISYTTCNGSTAPDIACPEDSGADDDCTITPAPPEETDCQETHENYCVPPYVAPCTTDESCGSEGFTCEAVPVSCGCSSPGSGSDGGSGSDSTGPDPRPGSDNDDCACPEPDETVRGCQLQELPCSSNDECSADFICHFQSAPAPDTSCSYDPATGTETCETSEVDPEDNQTNNGRCAPADYPYWASGTGSSKGDSNDESASEDASEDTTGNTNQPGAPNDNQQTDSDAQTDAQTDTDGCHIASLNTTNTSTTALLAAGAIGLFTFSRRKRR